MLLLLLLLLASFPTLTQCRVRHLTSSTPTLSSPLDTTLLTPPTLSSPPDTLSTPPPQPLLPPVDPDMPVTACSPPPPAIPQCCCCVLAAPPPPGDSRSMLHQLFVSTFGRICIGVFISGVIYVLYWVFCRRRRAPPPSQSQRSGGPRSHPHSVSGSEVQTPDQSPPPPPPHYSFDIGTDPGLGDFIPDGLGFGFGF